MLASFLLTLREGLEAALIIGIVLGVLLNLKRTDLAIHVWRGVGAAVILSITIATTLNLLDLTFEGRSEEVFEGTVLLLAACVITWMLIWMRRHGSNLKSEIETQTNQAALRNGPTGLLMLSFLAVLREGIELAFYLLAARLVSDPLQMLTGALLGLIAAIIFGWALFTSTKNIISRNFFSATNAMLIIFAAGMVGLGVHEYNEAGIIPVIIEHVWDFNPILSDKSALGQLLKELVGYNGAPSLSSVLGYIIYLFGILIFVIVQKRNSLNRQPQKEQN